MSLKAGHVLAPVARTGRRSDQACRAERRAVGAQAKSLRNEELFEGDASMTQA
jgi:hypothetical protein